MIQNISDVLLTEQQLAVGDLAFITEQDGPSRAIGVFRRSITAYYNEELIFRNPAANDAPAINVEPIA